MFKTFTILIKSCVSVSMCVFKHVAKIESYKHVARQFKKCLSVDNIDQDLCVVCECEYVCV